MNGSIYDELKKCAEDNSLIEIYTNYGGDSGTFDVGRILDANEGSFTYASVNTAGNYNGVRLAETGGVYRICRKSRYLKKLCEIMRIYGREKMPEEYRSFYPADIIAFLYTAEKEGVPVSVGYNGSDKYSVTGFVNFVTDDILEMETVDYNNAVITGTEKFRTDCISVLCCHSFEEDIIFELKKSGFLK